MDRWAGRVALVTGTSAGIGAAVAYQLLDHGVHVVGVARRVDKIEGAVAKARQDAKNRGRYHATKATPGKLYVKKCDVGKEEDILALFKWIKETLGGVDILINNAAIGGNDKITEAKTAEWRLLLDVNVLGLSICTREAVQNMRARGVDDGHIIHISSIGGHSIPSSIAAMYCSTKHAVGALAEGLRKDFVEHKSNMKISKGKWQEIERCGTRHALRSQAREIVSNVREYFEKEKENGATLLPLAQAVRRNADATKIVSPGKVETEFRDKRPNFQTEEVKRMPGLESEDVADAVLYALATPPHVQIHEILIKPVGESL